MKALKGLKYGLGVHMSVNAACTSACATMPAKGASFDAVRKIARELPRVEEGMTYGSPALKVDGHLLACIAINKSAEPNSLVARVGFEEREELLKHDPGTFYLTPHYENHPVVLVRLSRIDSEGLKSLLGLAWRFATTKKAGSRRGAGRLGDRSHGRFK